MISELTYRVSYTLITHRSVVTRTVSISATTQAERNASLSHSLLKKKKKLIFLLLHTAYCTGYRGAMGTCGYRTDVPQKSGFSSFRPRAPPCRPRRPAFGPGHANRTSPPAALRNCGAGRVFAPPAAKKGLPALRSGTERVLVSNKQTKTNKQGC